MEIKKIMLHPFKNQKAMEGAFFESSIDGTTYTTLYKIEKLMFGWNFLFVKKTVKARYIRFSFSQKGT